MTEFITPKWPAPKQIKAICTTKYSGNLALHVGDDPIKVAQNRQQLINELQLAQPPHWLQQIHSADIINADQTTANQQADAAYSRCAHTICGVLTADCLPVLFCDQQGTQIAAAHAGWRGMLKGILENTVNTFAAPKQEILVYLGPAISQQHYEIRKDVYDPIVTSNPECASAFKQINDTQWLADLYLLAKLRLQAHGVTQIFGGNFCTYSDKELFYSYRRDGQKTGRQLSLIWMNH